MAKKTQTTKTKATKAAPKKAEKATAKPPVKAAVKPGPKKSAAVPKIESTWSAQRVRELWIEFFKSKKHAIVPSASLLPAGDPTLLFTTAGMVPFKGYFAGTETPPSRRVATIQKCLRTTDLESVGKTERHCTFFEMLGNFSFGDYFKRESILWAYEFSLKHLELDPEKIHVTVYQDDDEAEKIWNQEVGVPMDHIRRLGKKDNWWGPAGDSGACGPCSELYLDRGIERCDRTPGPHCGPGCSCDRFMEYWNLVFNQFHQDTSGQLSPLPQTGIDTGAGLERITMLKLSENSVYDTDELANLIQIIEGLTETLGGKKISYVPSASNASSFRVLTDHSRAATFAISDGIFPDNTGRGYVIRRIIRRGLLFAREIGINKPVLHLLVPEVVRIYQKSYPDLARRAKEITNIVRQEEERFLRTLEQGITRFNEYLSEMGTGSGKEFSGELAFRLYDTYGFPLEMTVELAERHGLTVGIAQFESSMQKQKERASRPGQFKELSLPNDFKPAPTKFKGYDQYTLKSKVVSVLQTVSGSTELIIADKLSGEGILVLDETPFYAEGGGQMGDIGFIRGEHGVFAVRDTKIKQGFVLHIGEVTEGFIQTNDAANAEIDSERRERLVRHHSATHLLNRALRENLGDHILQTGSLVAPDYLRFDFSHGEKIPTDTLRKIEKHVNHAIALKQNVNAKIMSIDEAKSEGALATFGEKYGTEVRVIAMGDNGKLSKELCGGCHVSNTGDVGYFLITREASPGAGNRRIEALAGNQVIQHLDHAFQKLSAAIAEHNESVLKVKSDELKPFARTLTEEKKNALMASPEGISEIAEGLAKDTESLEAQSKLLARASKKAYQVSLDTLDESGVATIGTVSVLSQNLGDSSVESARQIGDRLKEKHRVFCGLFGLKTERGPVLVFLANKGALDAGVDCGKLIRECAPIIGGGGGGKPDMAQAGGKNQEMLEAALAHALSSLKTQLQG